MTAASVLGVPITPARADACRELLAGVAAAEAWAELAPLVAESERFAWGVSPEAPGEGTRHPPFGEPYVVKMPSLAALARCALGTTCARCSTSIEDEGEELDDGWCCSACRTRQRAIDAFRRRSAAWFERAATERRSARIAFRRRAAVWLRRERVQLGLFGDAPPVRRRKARR